ncbi:DUF6506 family protein [Promicromonospora vindobonensis]|uniref:DUF6506 family protein n=1 Tax=Promicromonospora vindobonensis TaxID=195748 RepID=A0ABW5VP58_9MICO
MAHWAFVYEHPGSDPVRDRHRLGGGGQDTELIPVPTASDAAEIAADLVREGVSLIELCGGFDTATVAAVVAAVDGRAAVGHVTYSVESLAAGARYAEEAAGGGASR